MTLYAFFSPTAQAKTGSGFWVTLTGERVQATLVTRDREMSEYFEAWSDDYGRPIEAPPLPQDLVYVGEVDGISHEWDVDHLHPDISLDPAFYRDLYTKKYGRHDYIGAVKT